MGIFTLRSPLLAVLVVSLNLLHCEKDPLPTRPEPSSAPLGASVKVVEPRPVPAAIPLATALALPCRSAAELGLHRLDLIEVSGDEARAVRAARRELVKDGETPSQFFANVRANDAEIEVELWHESAFAPEHCSSIGNPGGKSRTMIFDLHARLLKVELWQ
jgi:hypothetical protein